MNQEQGCVPDNKISCLFCFSTICFTLPEVKIHLWFIYTMQTTNSSMLGTEHSEFGTDMSTLKWHIPYFLYFRPPHHAPGCKPSFKPYIKTARTQLPFGAKQIPASLKSGLSLAVSVSRGVPVFSVRKFTIHPFIHLFIHLWTFCELQAGPGPLYFLWGCWLLRTWSGWPHRKAHSPSRA